MRDDEMVEAEEPQIKTFKNRKMVDNYNDTRAERKDLEKYEAREQSKKEWMPDTAPDHETTSRFWEEEKPMRDAMDAEKPAADDKNLQKRKFGMLNSLLGHFDSMSK